MSADGASRPVIVVFFTQEGIVGLWGFQDHRSPLRFATEDGALHCHSIDHNGYFSHLKIKILPRDLAFSTLDGLELTVPSHFIAWTVTLPSEKAQRALGFSFEARPKARASELEVPPR